MIFWIFDGLFFFFYYVPCVFAINAVSLPKDLFNLGCKIQITGQKLGGVVGEKVK